MRVAFIVTGLETGGAEMMLLKVLSRLDRDRFDPVVVSLREAGDLADRFRAARVPIYSVRIPPGELMPVAGLYRLVALTRALRPDVLQGWMYHGNLAAQCVATFLSRGVPVLWNVRDGGGGLPQAKAGTRLVVRIGGWMSRLPTRIVNNSRSSASAHEQCFGYRADKRLVIPNGFDTDVFRPATDARAAIRRELGLDEQAIVIGMIGRFTPEKNHGGFLRAAAHVAARCPDARFVLAGPHVDTANTALVEMIRTLGLDDAVRLLGKRDDMPAVMASLDVAVSSSTSEGFPNVVGEAMSCRVPCVVTDVGDSAFVVGDTGVVVEPSNDVALAGAIEALIRAGPDARRRLGDAARRRIEERFSLAAVVAMYEQLYESVFSRKDDTCVA